MITDSKDFFNNLSSDDKLLAKKIADWISISENGYVPKFSFFLDERQCAFAESILREYKFHSYRLFGGYEDAERKVIAIFPQVYELENIDYPIKSILFTFREEDKLFHRDFLGALMSLQIKRETVGDILVSPGNAIVFVYNSVSEHLINNINKIGSAGVKVSYCNDANISVQRKFQELSGTVASLRLDCLVSFALKISRDKASDLIKSKSVEVNHLLIKNPSFMLKVGDEFSIRQFGKFKFITESGLSKKGRYCIHINKFI